VLVAEDDETNALLTGRLLTKMGHVVVRVRDGMEAVRAASSEAFDLILMDVRMPELDGLEATAQIRAAEVATGRRTAIVALTAGAMKGDDQLCLDAGMDDYLMKPVSAPALREALQRWARRS
jgi:CheY-like chemotaxis protein